jgi:gliding motility-associated-like protein
MSQCRFSFLLWSIRPAVVMAGLLLLAGDVEAQLTLSVGTTTANCGSSNGTITAVASGGSGDYSYSLDYGAVVNSSGFFSGLVDGQYRLTVTDVITGASVSNLNIYVSSGCMTVTTAVNDATCGNTNGKIVVTATGTSGYQYSIDGTDFFSTNVFTNVAAGTYTVVVEDADGNLTTAQAKVDDLAGPTVIAIGGDATCLNNDGTINVSTSGGTAPFLYSVNSGSYVSSPTFTGVASGTQNITVKDANGCVVPATVTVFLTNNLTLNVDPGTTICQGTNTTLPVSSNAASYAWTPVSGLSDATIADPVASPSTTTTYEVTATLGICPPQSGSVTVSVLPAPVAAVGPADTICAGKSAQLSGAGGATYQWSPATYLSDPTSADPTVDKPSSTINYSLTVYGADGCASIQPATELVYVTPPPAVFPGDDTAVLAGQTIPLDAIDVNNSGFTSYQWSPASGLSSYSIQDPVAQITQDITYTVVATTAAGCSGTGSIVIAVVGSANMVVPNAFTPNGDGHNDVLRVDAIGIRDFKYFKVFNRWGAEVFSTTNQGIGWDGTRGGRIQDAGVYVWAAMGLDLSGKVVERRGTVILIR